MVVDGGFDAVGAIMGSGRPTPAAFQYFNNQYQNIVSMAQNVGNVVLQQVYDGAATMYNHIMTSRPWEIAEGIFNQASHMMDPNMVRPLHTVSEMQAARPIMQRWIMANPEIRQMHIDNKVEGYHESYINTQPGLVGVQHYDYRRATNSMFTFVPRADETSTDPQLWQATTYVEALLEGDRELSHYEKKDIGITWDALMHAMSNQSFDPTSIFNARL